MHLDECVKVIYEGRDIEEAIKQYNDIVEKDDVDEKAI